MSKPEQSRIPSPGHLFQHQDGGVYCFRGTAIDTRDGSLLYLYEHLWPFEIRLYARPAEEWASRFRLMRLRDLDIMRSGDRAAARAAVRAAQQARRSASLSPSAPNA